MMDVCLHENCNEVVKVGSKFCLHHSMLSKLAQGATERAEAMNNTAPQEFMQLDRRTMAQMYPKYYKKIPKGIIEADTYVVNMMFPVDDPTGCILHARKKLLVPGTRSGGKSMYKDIKEARDTLDRWLELNKVPLGSEESFSK